MPPSWSRARPKSKGDIVPKIVRTHMDSVSGELTRVILDDVQLRYESVVRFLEGKAHFGDGILTDRGKTSSSPTTTDPRRCGRGEI